MVIFLAVIIFKALRKSTIHKARSVTPALHCLGYSGLVIATGLLYFLLALRKPHEYYSHGIGGVPLPCTTRRDVIRMTRGSFLPLAVCEVKDIISTAHSGLIGNSSWPKIDKMEAVFYA